jgi:hypothetical protein
MVITPTMSRMDPITVRPTETRILPVAMVPVSTAQPSHAGHIAATVPELASTPSGTAPYADMAYFPAEPIKHNSFPRRHPGMPVIPSAIVE